MADPVEWAKVSPSFGAALPHGSCNAVTEHDGRAIVCGWPRRANGTCPNGHPAPLRVVQD